MNILIKWIFKAEQAFYATTIRFFPTLAINQGLLSDWDDSRLTNERNQYRKTCRELKELLNRTQQLPGFQGLLNAVKLYRDSSLAPACSPSKEKAPVSGAATPEG